jgi:hypothetical protein
LVSFCSPHQGESSYIRCRTPPTVSYGSSLPPTRTATPPPTPFIGKRFSIIYVGPVSLSFPLRAPYFDTRQKVLPHPDGSRIFNLQILLSAPKLLHSLKWFFFCRNPPDTWGFLVSPCSPLRGESPYIRCRTPTTASWPPTRTVTPPLTPAPKGLRIYMGSRMFAALDPPPCLKSLPHMVVWSCLLPPLTPLTPLRHPP